MIIPTLETTSASRSVTDVFRGYNHNLKIGDGEWYDTKNLTAEYAPMLSPRRKRGTLDIDGVQGMIEKDALYYVSGGTLYSNFIATGLTGLSDGEKQLISMGAYIIILPDKKWYNTAASGAEERYGSIEAFFEVTGKEMRFDMCHVDGSLYSVIKSIEEPDPGIADIWIQAIGDNKTALKVYDTGLGWTEVNLNTVYTKVTFNTMGVVPKLFSEMDAVDISDCSMMPELNGSKLIYAVGGAAATGSSDGEYDWIVVLNQMDDDSKIYSAADIKISRTMPALNYVCEAQNRLWGCYYGYNPETKQTLNEIYCSALGDFKNWNRFSGISTDSWVGSVGTDGYWTGCINYLGRPTFFKENHIHVVSISQIGAHQINETPCRGVQLGSHKSLCIVNEVLYYKSRTDICAYQGSFPQSVSEALGETVYTEAAAGVYGDQYYISMCHNDSTGKKWCMFTYDTGTHLWMKEDDLHAVLFCRVDDEIYAADSNGNLLALRGTTGTPEGPIEWYAESSIMAYEYPDHKYLSRYNIRLRGDRGSKIDIYIQYDSEGPWIHSGTVRQTGTNTVTIPIRPRRCDHMRLRLVGTGGVKIYSIARILEVGSDA